ncbi:MAG TPA: sortase [Tepidiformaceae bacterium]|nr:sortase [Tepidiformaceae bacterium]
MILPRTRKPSASTLVAVGMVAIAGGIAWLATGGRAPEMDWPAGDTERVTLPVERDTPPAEQMVYASVSTGGLPTRIVVPSADVDAAIVEVGVVIDGGEARWETAWHAAGHHMDSALPGQPGNMVISGHVSVANRANLAVFKHLDRVAEGDVIEVYSGHDIYRYAVSKMFVVPPDQTRLLRSTAGSTVTLITCTKDLKDRLVVVGTLTGVVTPERDA